MSWLSPRGRLLHARGPFVYLIVVFMLALALCVGLAFRSAQRANCESRRDQHDAIVRLINAATSPPPNRVFTPDQQSRAEEYRRYLIGSLNKRPEC